MMPLSDGKPLMEHIVSYLESFDIEPILVISKDNHYKQLTDYFGDRVEYSIHDGVSGTAGEVYKAKRFVEDEDDFWVYYGDTLTDLNMNKMYDFHKRNDNFATLCGHKGVTLETGLLYGNRKRLVGIKEKPTLPFYRNCPIFMCSNDVLGYVKPDTDFMKDIFPKALQLRKKLGLYNHKGGYYIDVGTLPSYERALELKL
jgi:NDP-sugar pyrophosphorylase family protein